MLPDILGVPVHANYLTAAVPEANSSSPNSSTIDDPSTDAGMEVDSRSRKKDGRNKKKSCEKPKDVSMDEKEGINLPNQNGELLGRIS
jgi:hypothetical protein